MQVVKMGSNLNERLGSQQQSTSSCTMQHRMGGGSSGASQSIHCLTSDFPWDLGFSTHPPLQTGLLPTEQSAPRLCQRRPLTDLMHPLHIFIFFTKSTQKAASSRGRSGCLQNRAGSYLSLQQSHFIREVVDDELLSERPREQVAEGRSHRRQGRAQHQPGPWPKECSGQDVLPGHNTE